MWGPNKTAQAQGDWPPASILWQPEPGSVPYVNNATNLVADVYGTAHLTWLNFPRAVGPSGDQVLMYYSQWDGQTWTTPVDIFVGTNTDPLGGSVLLPTDDGYLHVFWISNARLMHSIAWGGDATRPQAWSSPETAVAFSYPLFTPFDAAIDSKGHFHVVVTVRVGNLYYLRSEDQGRTWTDPVAITNVAANIATYMPKIAIATDGRIHVVWAEVDPNDNSARTGQVKYTFSVDDGDTWSEPLDFGGPAHGDPNVAAFGANDVYVAWNGGVASEGGRFFRYSRDGGITWSDRIKFSERRGLSNYPSIVSDSLGRLHLITGDGEYVMWDGAAFTPPVSLSPVDIQTERCRLTVINGNTLVAVFPPDDGVVYTAARLLNAPAVPPRTRPERIAPTPAPKATEVSPAVVSEAANASAGVSWGLDATAGPAISSSVSPVVVGTISALVVVMAAALWSRWRQKT